MGEEETTEKHIQKRVLENSWKVNCSNSHCYCLSCDIVMMFSVWQRSKSSEQRNFRWGLGPGTPAHCFRSLGPSCWLAGWLLGAWVDSYLSADTLLSTHSLKGIPATCLNGSSSANISRLFLSPWIWWSYLVFSLTWTTLVTLPSVCDWPVCPPFIS